MTEAFNTRTDGYANRAEFEESPMQTTAPHLMRAYARQPVSFVRGNGARLWDDQGVEYLDAIAGVAVTSLGHAHPEIAAVIAEQAGALLHTSNVFRIDWQEQLGERLCALTGMESAFFCNSGAEANETALKLARLHAHRRQVARPQILVMGNAFHGRTLATLAATDNAANQQGFGPLLPGFLRAPYGDISAVRQAAEQSPDIVAVLIESVQGEGGIRVASAEYLRELRALCDQRDWLLMLDEIQAGMGRTGAWFGYAHAGISPDVVTLAKALGNGFPIGACLARGIAADLFSPGQHGSTFGGNPLAMAVGAAAFAEISKPETLAHVNEIAGYLKQQLHGLKERFPDVIVEVRGKGLLMGMKLVPNNREFMGWARDEAHLLIAGGGDNLVRILPPLNFTLDEAREAVERLEKTCEFARTKLAAA